MAAEVMVTSSHYLHYYIICRIFVMLNTFWLAFVL